MRKIVFTLFFVLSVMIFSNVTFAGENNYVEFEITGGIEYFDKAESTFDTSRTITGIVEDGTCVEISVYTLDEQEERELRDVYCFEVGASAIFSQSVDLYVGENIIVVSASKEGKETVETEATIKRKPDEIKKELENSISIPGEGLKSTFSTMLSLKK